jgi:hypothetical protein
MSSPYWENEVRALYLREPDMEVDEFEALMATALQGERPDHPQLPLFPPAFLSVGGRFISTGRFSSSA